MSERKITVAVTEGGGRGAAVAEAYAKSPFVKHVIVIPGNDMVHLVTDGKLIDEKGFRKIKLTDAKTIVDLCQYYGVTLLDVCQDNAVASGVADDARKVGILTLGPSRAAGKIEWDKIDARILGRNVGIRQPRFRNYDSIDQALDNPIGLMPYDPENKFFVKAAGLAAGKGAIGARSKSETLQAIRMMKQFREAGRRFLVEEWIESDDGTPGEEFSYFVLCNGEEFVYLGNASDKKPLGNRDEGPITGSMGGHSETDIVDEDLKRQVEEDAIRPILRELAYEERPYTGVLYYSGMKVIRDRGFVPYCIELNSRWGDPEAQIIIPGIQNDMYEVAMAVATNSSLNQLNLIRGRFKRVVVTIASLGYPGDYSLVKGKKIYGIKEAMETVDVSVYGAGVSFDGEDYRVNGGRLLNVVGKGNNILEARKNAYAGTSYIVVEGYRQTMRDDIALQEVERYYQRSLNI